MLGSGRVVRGEEMEIVGGVGWGAVKGAAFVVDLGVR